MTLHEPTTTDRAALVDVGDGLRGPVPGAPHWSVADLLEVPYEELLAAARRVRDEAHGNRVTFSPKVFVPLTMLCRDRCGYCTFAKAPARLSSPYLSIDEVVELARRGT